MNDFTVFKKINQIISEDSKSATYKLALLRGTIDIISENSPYLIKKENKVIIPMGLLIEKWILFYYPLYASDQELKQITSKRTAFEKYLKPIISYYNGKNGLSFFYSDLCLNGLKGEVNSSFLSLAKSVCDTIIKQPMHYIGSSINEQDKIFILEEKRSKINSDTDINLKTLVENFGAFSIPREYYEAFSVLGSFINGQESILLEWARFTNRQSPATSIEYILSKLQESPVVKRDAETSKRRFKEITSGKLGDIQCVWSGKKVVGQSYHVDHIIPFSIWKNNDLWNLLPASQNYNSSKKNFISDPKLIIKQKELFFFYWDIIRKGNEEQFDKELQITLLGSSSMDNWKEKAIEQLASTSHYLIEDRGFKSWKPN